MVGDGGRRLALSVLSCEPMSLKDMSTGGDMSASQPLSVLSCAPMSLKEAVHQAARPSAGAFSALL